MQEQLLVRATLPDGRNNPFYRTAVGRGQQQKMDIGIVTAVEPSRVIAEGLLRGDLYELPPPSSCPSYNPVPAHTATNPPTGNPTAPVGGSLAVKQLIRLCITDSGRELAGVSVIQPEEILVGSGVVKTLGEKFAVLQCHVHGEINVSCSVLSNRSYVQERVSVFYKAVSFPDNTLWAIYLAPDDSNGLAPPANMTHDVDQQSITTTITTNASTPCPLAMSGSVGSSPRTSSSSGSFGNLDPPSTPQKVPQLPQGLNTIYCRPPANHVHSRGQLHDQNYYHRKPQSRHSRPHNYSFVGSSRRFNQCISKELPSELADTVMIVTGQLSDISLVAVPEQWPEDVPVVKCQVYRELLLAAVPAGAQVPPVLVGLRIRVDASQTFLAFSDPGVKYAAKKVTRIDFAFQQAAQEPNQLQQEPDEPQHRCQNQITTISTTALVATPPSADIPDPGPVVGILIDIADHDDNDDMTESLTNHTHTSPTTGPGLPDLPDLSGCLGPADPHSTARSTASFDVPPLDAPGLQPPSELQTQTRGCSCDAATQTDCVTSAAIAEAFSLADGLRGFIQLPGGFRMLEVPAAHKSDD